MANKIRFTENDIGDDYDPSESDNDYSEREKFLLKKVKNLHQNDSDSEEDVLAFDEDNSDFDDRTTAEKFEAPSDIESENGDDDIPDSRAWGKNKRLYHDTDFVDQDYSTYSAREEEYAQREENEARMIQMRLAKQLDEADFSLDLFSTDNDQSTAKNELAKEFDTKLKTDLSDLSERQKLQLFKKDSPEFEGLAKDLLQQLEESETYLEPFLNKLKEINVLNHPIIEFVKMKNEINLNYCTNISFYLLLKAQRVPVKNHPILKRLVQLRELLLQLEEKFENDIRPQMDKFMKDCQSGKTIEMIIEEKPKTQLNKKLNILKATESDVSENSDLEDVMNNDVDMTDNEEEFSPKWHEYQQNGSDKEMSDQEHTKEEINENVREKRGITYQIKKNKGLTPHRKKELRNPRVKHRMKYRKALIRRKGAVRTVRKEEKRYAGEHSGIKITVRKSIKLQ